MCTSYSWSSYELHKTQLNCKKLDSDHPATFPVGDKQGESNGELQVTQHELRKRREAGRHEKMRLFP